MLPLYYWPTTKVSAKAFKFFNCVPYMMQIKVPSYRASWKIFFMRKTEYAEGGAILHLSTKIFASRFLSLVGGVQCKVRT